MFSSKIGSLPSTPQAKPASVPQPAAKAEEGRKSLWVTVKKGISSLSFSGRENVGQVFRSMQKEPSRIFPKIFASVVTNCSGADAKASKVFLMHYLQKGAAIGRETADKFHRPTSPLAQDSQHYHRDYQNNNVVLNALANTAVHAAAEAGLSLNEVICVADERSHMETLHVYRNVKDVNTLEEMIDHIDAAVDNLKNGDRIPCTFLCIDKMVDPNLPFNERIKQVKEIAAKINQTVPKDLQAQVYEKCGIVTTQKLDGQPFLISPSFTGDKWEVDNLKGILREHVVTAGQVPTMLEATTALANLRSFEDILGGKLSTDTLKLKEIKFTTLSKFYGQPAVKKYSAISAGNYPPAVKLLASANAKMARQLNNERLEKSLSDPKTRALVNGSLNRISALMELSIENTHDHATFSLCHELIAEEHLLLLNVSQPFQPGDFQKIYLQNRSEALKSEYSKDKQRPEHTGKDPLVLAMRSGMSCVDAVVRGLHKGKPDLCVAGLKNSYFQTHQSLGELGNEKGSASYFGIDPNGAGGIGEALQQLPKTPDLVYLDLRPAADLTSTSYAPKDIHVIDELLKGRKPEDGPLTLALDVTLDKLHSKEIDDFVAKHQSAIDDGSLNLVLYRSGQKFDQLGVDKFNAGYMELHTADGGLRNTFQNIGGQLEGLDYQAICLFHSAAHSEIHDYLKLHYKNTDDAYHELNSLVGAQGLLRVTPKLDEKLTYIEFTFPALADQDDAKAFQSFFVEYLSEQSAREGVPLFVRDSFGYNESTLCGIGNEKVRLSLGTHPENELRAVCGLVQSLAAKIQDFASKQEGYDLKSLTPQQLTALLKFARKNWLNK